MADTSLNALYELLDDASDVARSMRDPALVEDFANLPVVVLPNGQLPIRADAGAYKNDGLRVIFVTPLFVARVHHGKDQSAIMLFIKGTPADPPKAMTVIRGKVARTNDSPLLATADDGWYYIGNVPLHRGRPGAQLNPELTELMPHSILVADRHMCAAYAADFSNLAERVFELAERVDLNSYVPEPSKNDLYVVE